MNCRKFLQFEIIKPERLVKKEGEPEAPPAAPKAPKPPEAPKPSDKTPQQQAEVSKKAQKQGNEAHAKDAAGADEQLDEQTAAAEKAKQEEAAKTINNLASTKYPDAFAKFRQAIRDSKNDPDKIEEAKKTFVDSVEAEDKQKLTEALNIIDLSKPEEEEGSSDKTSDALKGAGFGALLEKLIDRLTKLFDKLSGELTKLFGSFEKKTAKIDITSPLGGNKKFTILRAYKPNEGILIAAEINTEIYSPGPGTITEIDRNNNMVEITEPDGRSKVTYKNVIPDSNLKTGDTATKIEPGKPILIGKAASNAGVEFRYFDSNGTEQDKTEYFKQNQLTKEDKEEPAKEPAMVAQKDVSAKPADAKPKI